MIYRWSINEFNIELQGDIMATKLKRLAMKHKKNKLIRRRAR